MFRILVALMLLVGSAMSAPAPAPAPTPNPSPNPHPNPHPDPKPALAVPLVYSTYAAAPLSYSYSSVDQFTSHSVPVHAAAVPVHTPAVPLHTPVAYSHPAALPALSYGYGYPYVLV